MTSWRYSIAVCHFTQCRPKYYLYNYNATKGTYKWLLYNCFRDGDSLVPTCRRKVMPSTTRMHMCVIIQYFCLHNFNVYMYVQYYTERKIVKSRKVYVGSLNSRKLKVNWTLSGQMVPGRSHSSDRGSQSAKLSRNWIQFRVTAYGTPFQPPLTWASCTMLLCHVPFLLLWTAPEVWILPALAIILPSLFLLTPVSHYVSQFGSLLFCRSEHALNSCPQLQWDGEFWSSQPYLRERLSLNTALCRAKPC